MIRRTLLICLFLCLIPFQIAPPFSPAIDSFQRVAPRKEAEKEIKSNIHSSHFLFHVPHSIAPHLCLTSQNIKQTDFQINLFDPLKKYFPQNPEEAAFKLPVSPALSLISNFSVIRRQKENNNSSLLVDFNRNAFLALTYAHCKSMWHPEMVIGLSNSDGDYGFSFHLTKNF